MSAIEDTDGGAHCVCHRCIREKGLTGGAWDEDPLPLNVTRMVVCSTCGNKRCPRASDHHHACTHSNDVGQAGSVYAGATTEAATAKKRTT